VLLDRPSIGPEQKAELDRKEKGKEKRKEESEDTERAMAWK